MGNLRKSKNGRVLDIYSRLCQGKLINKGEEAKAYKVDERSIQRDIDDIRAFLDEQMVLGITGGKRIEYDRARKGFIMTDNEERFLNNGQILAVSKILLESRAFAKEEISAILEKITTECVPCKNRKMVSDLIANEQFHYVEVSNHSCIHNKIWDIGVAIAKSSIMKIEYHKQVEAKGVIERSIEPLAVLFSEYYFYLIANIVELDELSGTIQRQYQYPAVFRIDRIQSYHTTDMKFKIPYKDRFEEGVFRKRVQFMYPGELMKIQFKYTGKSPQAILDRLPTARVTEVREGASYIEAEVYGAGILMWLLSQGEYVEVLKPPGLREQIRETLKKMICQYEIG